MKKLIAAGFVSSLLSGCFAAIGVENSGVLYRDVTLPLTATLRGPGAKVGRATATSILGLVNIGDAGIDAAKRNGEIRQIAYIDYHLTQVLGIFATYEVIVYGD